MPCDLCRSNYVNVPCSQKPHKCTPTSIGSNNLAYGLIIFKELSKECPCSNCLVKMMCGTKRKACPEYIKLLEKIVDSLTDIVTKLK